MIPRMKLVVVAGSGSNCGKTTLVCRLLAAIPGLGAVKVSPRDEEPRVEWGPGSPGKDTARYAASGAVKVARLICPREAVSGLWEAIGAEFAACAGVIVEGGSWIIPGEDRLTIFVRAAEGLGERPDRTARLLAAADLQVIVHSEDWHATPSEEGRWSHSGAENTVFHVALPPLEARESDWRPVFEAVSRFLRQGALR
jgi:hypothetical protein